MSRFLPALLVAGAAALPALAATPAPTPAPQVTIYRCTDARGVLALRDSPCHDGERQQVRSMLRPSDPPVRRVSTAAPRIDTPMVAAPTRVIYRTAPRPLYECVTPDGARYTSETPEGNPRWVPLWTLGYPAAIAGSGVVEGGWGGHVEQRGGGTLIRADVERRWRYPDHGVGVPVAIGGAGTWVRDACQTVPAVEACSLLRDQRAALGRRWFSALQGDRDAIEREQRRIDARLGEDCT